MRNDTNRKILTGAGLLGAIVAGSFSTSAFAKPKHEEKREVKEARKAVRQERKDVRKATSPADRREEREELREAREELRRERQDLIRERQRNNGNRYGTYNRNRNSNRVYNNDYNRNRYNDGIYNNNYNRNTQRTLEGVVTNDTRGNTFVLRTENGRTLRVVASNGEPRRLDRGDIVRVSGVYTGGVFRAYDVDIVDNR